MHRPMLIVPLALCLVTSDASAQLVTVTPELFARAKGLAEAAKAKNPTSPTKASEEFGKAFDRAFGDSINTAATLHYSDALSLFLVTPLARARGQFTAALKEMGELPSEFEGPDDTVSIIVNPKTINAPNIRKIAAFSGTTPVDVDSRLTDHEFETRMGAKATLATGEAHVPITLFEGQGPVKFVFMPASGSPLEVELNARALKRIR